MVWRCVDFAIAIASVSYFFDNFAFTALCYLHITKSNRQGIGMEKEENLTESTKVIWLGRKFRNICIDDDIMCYIASIRQLLDEIEEEPNV